MMAETKDSNKEVEQTTEEPCVFNCDFCPEDKFFKCKQIGKERI